ncbi:hypothetical protein, variant [Cryptococcus amylolentus CBS 6039]|uniref:Uncharacterized protein n=1 Tax=Cryptococcus amylolentus CBS 6039 TaxID=1295533 RepID=A0A1E3HN96_9TREE|nr:hypothetical protein L202_05718 [Cryptococcus amylolentus CBS 6039]XP_018992570.1 hypothetical protein, variant [Cryptococcus amylolentus CBS 6039]ODN77195.1 hypothetical protein L202_05718 [Cryptococcus amylolentus CBS 6039]ODN77196.1 hypothetical protein, variant [Cryptococcus amylolentus CBS 6039]
MGPKKSARKGANKGGGKGASKPNFLYGFDRYAFDDPETAPLRTNVQGKLMASKLVKPTKTKMEKHLAIFCGRLTRAENAGTSNTELDLCALFINSLPLELPEFSAAYAAFRVSDAPTWNECLRIYKSLLASRPPHPPKKAVTGGKGGKGKKNKGGSGICPRCKTNRHQGTGCPDWKRSASPETENESVMDGENKDEREDAGVHVAGVEGRTLGLVQSLKTLSRTALRIEGKERYGGVSRGRQRKREGILVLTMT